jgi:hypothetical protein
MEKLNRAQRRQSKFGGGRATEHGGWPTHQPNPVFIGDAATDDPSGEPTRETGGEATNEAATDQAIAGRPDQDQTAQTGPGTGGATEQAGRAPRHEGTHASNSTKG